MRRPEKNQDGGFSLFSASGGPRRAPGPSKNDPGRKTGPGDAVGTSGDRVLKKSGHRHVWERGGYYSRPCGSCLAEHSEKRLDLEGPSWISRGGQKGGIARGGVSESAAPRHGDVLIFSGRGPRKSRLFPRDRIFILGSFLTLPGPGEVPGGRKLRKTSVLIFSGRRMSGQTSGDRRSAPRARAALDADVEGKGGRGSSVEAREAFGRSSPLRSDPPLCGPIGDEEEEEEKDDDDDHNGEVWTLTKMQRAGFRRFRPPEAVDPFPRT